MKLMLTTKSKGKYNMIMPTEEVDKAGNELSKNGLRLLMHYYSKGDSWDWKDDEICKSLIMSKRVLTETRKELTDKGYLLIFKGTKSNPMTNIFVGKKAVSERLNPNINQDQEDKNESELKLNKLDYYNPSKIPTMQNTKKDK